MSVERLLAFAALFILAVTTGVAQERMEWSEWRGGEKQGRLESGSLQGSWMIKWQTPIPGEGHSSPIVAGKNVLVTTAREVPAPKRTLDAVIGLLGLLLAATALSAGFLGGRSCAEEGRVVKVTAVVVLVAAAALLAGYSQSVFDFQAAPERGWVAGGLAGMAALGVVSISGSPRAGFLLLGWALVLALSVPDPAHTALENWHSAASGVVYATVAMPLLLGLGICLSGRSRLAGRTLIGIGLALPWLLILWVALFEAGQPGIYTVAERHRPFTSTLVVGLSVAAVAACAVWLRIRPGKLVRLSLSVGAAWLLAYGALVGVDAALRWSPYLDHVLGAIQPASLFPGNVEAVLAVLLFSGLAVGLAWRSRRADGWARNALALFAVGAASVFFVYARYLPKWPRLERSVVCVDRSTGTIRWISPGLQGERGEMNRLNSPATPTPATNGEYIYAYFGTPGLLCVDFSGNLRWTHGPLPFVTREGAASSPILYGGKLFLLSESDAGRWVAAFDCASGRQIWKTLREAKVHSYAGNCRTPSIEEVNGRKLLLVWGYEDLSGYDIGTGRKLFSYDLGGFGVEDNPVAMVATDVDRVYLAGFSRTVCLEKSRLGEPAAPVLWDRPIEEGTQCASPLALSGMLCAVSDLGTAYALNAGNGRLLWQNPLEQQHYASPISAGNRLALTNTKGRVTILDSGSGAKLAAHDLGQPVYASPAAVPGSLYFRTTRSLLRVDTGPVARP